MSEGILIGADRQVEEFLPWWWKYYSLYNSRPVSIVDFGMSEKGRAWCVGKMDIIEFKHAFDWMKSKSQIAPESWRQWKKQYHNGCASPNLWKSRHAWFKKPSACLLSPYDLTLWIDIDCEVCGSLEPIFDLKNKAFDLAIAREDFHKEWRPLYNSGVMLFRKNSPFLTQWHDRCRIDNGIVMGDQDVLTQLIVEGSIDVHEIPPNYNWLMYAGVHPGIQIAHWVSDWGKNYIRKFGGLHTLLEKSFAARVAAKHENN